MPSVVDGRGCFLGYVAGRVARASRVLFDLTLEHDPLLPALGAAPALAAVAIHDLVIRNFSNTRQQSWADELFSWIVPQDSHW